MIKSATLERIAHFDSHGLPVVSMYIEVPTDPKRRKALDTKLANLLGQIRSYASAPTLGRASRLSVRGDIERIASEFEVMRWNPGAHAVFSCSRGGLFEDLQLPCHLHDRIVADTTPWVRPVLGLLKEHHRAGVVVVDRGTARIWELCDAEMTSLTTIADPVLRKPNYAGWYGLEEHRVRGHAAELLRTHHRRVGNALARLSVERQFRLLILGGHQYELAALIELLPPAMQRCVAGTFPADTRAASSEVRRAAEMIVDSYERGEEQREVADVIGTAHAGGLATLGVDDTLRAGSAGAIELLLLQDDVTVPGVVCDRSHYLAREGARCPLCGSELRSATDILDELAKAVIDEGGVVEHVTTETALHQHVAGARLRFPLLPAAVTSP